VNGVFGTREERLVRSALAAALADYGLYIEPVGKSPRIRCREDNIRAGWVCSILMGDGANTQDYSWFVDDPELLGNLAYLEPIVETLVLDHHVGGIYGDT
jgi:hypothetical protein